MRDKRGYVPAEWMDEYPPTQGKHPDAFLHRTDAGLVLRAITSEGDDEIEDLALKAGEAVGFVWHEDRGSRVATIRSATDFDLDEGFDPDTNCFCDGTGLVEVENDLADLIAMLAKGAFECGHEFPVRREIEGWTWSDTVPFRLIVLESGAGHFEEVPKHVFEPSTGEQPGDCHVCGCSASNLVHNQ